ncbi:MAG: hypothetical protein NT028_07355 [candidate division Zixibacteria bacterium]|nr:hypothetical protein [candidate division Zixibacteria bacterium]
METEFKDIKEKLSDVAGILNQFKSEAVQLRVLEFLISDNLGSSPARAVRKGKGTKKKRAQREKPESESIGGKSKKKVATGGGKGAYVTIGNLINGGFFKQPRTLKDIIEHCDKKMALKFKANEISGKMVRYLRDEKLSREKNKDGQYQYVKA